MSDAQIAKELYELFSLIFGIAILAMIGWGFHVWADMRAMNEYRKSINRSSDALSNAADELKSQRG